MKYGPLLFLGVLGAVMTSWVGAVVAPHFQFGSQELVPIEDLGIQYPLDRSGEARQGAEVYRSLGCNYCHSQQVRQDPFRAHLLLADAGTNSAALRDLLARLRPDLPPRDVDALAGGSGPRPVLEWTTPTAAGEAMRQLTNVGARAEIALANVSADIRRGWGNRRTVSRDYLRDRPVMLGQNRLGPDLANIGARQTNSTLLLRKLYNARIDLPGSTMPRYPFLFTERTLRPGDAPSPDALPFPPGMGPSGLEVIPTIEARRLVAYLKSLRSDALFYEVFTPAPKRADAAGPAETNSPPAGAPPSLPAPLGDASTNTPAQP